jgi:hypothetical protein
VAGTLTIARTVVELDPKYVPTGESGFRVKQYPKNQHRRKAAIGPELVARLTVLISGRRRDALLFRAVARRHRDGTGQLYGLRAQVHARDAVCVYTKGSCRRESCREAVAAYRTAQRGQGRDRPPREQVPEEVRQARHMRRDWFRNRLFQPTIEAAGLEWRPRVHDLRHASASWAQAGGATVQQVREHLGRTSLRGRAVPAQPARLRGGCGLEASPESGPPARSTR